jgi:eukaryotic-like serine/threonine-protein kinase
LFQPTQGSLILGRYLLEHELEQGGMSSVWVAADLKLQRSVAVKLLKTNMGTSHEARLRFEREAMAVAQLQSPHVVQVFDYGVEHDSPIIVMERLHGEDLRTRLKREVRLALPLLAKMVTETAKGLSEAHAAGIVHRDLKPGNIFFARSRQDEVVKLLDFGVAKAMEGSAIGSGPSSGGLVGTPHYMSPEQARGSDDIDHRSDLWSLGVIIYHALTGRLPYGGNHTPEVLAKICTQRFAPPSAVSPDLPSELDTFMLRAMARDPNERFGSARDMSAAFTRIMPSGTQTFNIHEPPMLPVTDEEVTEILDHQPEMLFSGGLPPPPALPREFSPFPNELPSHPSTIGGAMIEGYERPSPAKRVIMWSFAALVVAGVAVAGAVVVFSPGSEAAPASTVDGPLAAAPRETLPDVEDEEQQPKAAPPKRAAPTPLPRVKAQPPAPREKPTPRRAAPQPRPPQPVPVAKAPEQPKPAPKETDWSRSRF